MQKSIIQAIEIFTFNNESARQQYRIEIARLQDFLYQKFDNNTAYTKYNTIKNNIKAYFAAKGISL